MIPVLQLAGREFCGRPSASQARRNGGSLLKIIGLAAGVSFHQQFGGVQPDRFHLALLK